jgi:hypothetical protein
MWSLTLKEEHWLKASENRELLRIFGLKRIELTGWFRKLHNEQLHNFYSSLKTVKLSDHIPSIG